MHNESQGLYREANNNIHSEIIIYWRGFASWFQQLPTTPCPRPLGHDVHGAPCIFPHVQFIRFRLFICGFRVCVFCVWFPCSGSHCAKAFASFAPSLLCHCVCDVKIACNKLLFVQMNVANDSRVSALWLFFEKCTWRPNLLDMGKRDGNATQYWEKKINYLLAPLETDTVRFVCQLNSSPNTPRCRIRVHFSVCISIR